MVRSITSRRWAGSVKPCLHWGKPQAAWAHGDRAKGVPILEGLGRGTLAIAVAHHQQRGGMDVLDEMDRGAFCVDRGFVVDGGAEVGESSTGRLSSLRSS